jgi:hypothetical protein
MIRGIYPDFEYQDADVSLTLYTRNFPQGAETTKGPYTLATGADRKDFRVSGKIAAARFSTASGATPGFRLGKPVFDAVPLGER